MKHIAQIAFLAAAVTLTALAWSDAADPFAMRSAFASAPADLSDEPLMDWPLYYGVFQTSEIRTMFDCFGNFGSYFYAGPLYGPQWPVTEFVSPPTSRIRYFTSASLWLGGMIDGEPRVSTGHESYSFYGAEFSSTRSISDTVLGSVTNFDYASDFSLRSEFSDTLRRNYYYDFRPLSVLVAMRGHVWHDEAYNQIVMYDMVVTNIGDKTIEHGHIGMYVDPDACYECISGYNDDLVGSINEHGIVYGIDNDGEPRDGQFILSESPTRGMGMKFLRSSFGVTDSSFNWWDRGSGSAEAYGPSPVDSLGNPLYCEHEGEFVGVPYYDEEKYCLMQSPEWDFDQFRTSHPPDGWNQPPDMPTIALGVDIRFLLSIGTFDLPPDSSVRAMFAFFVGKGVHTQPGNINNLPDNPDAYLANLDLTDIIHSALVADTLATSLLDPLLPVIGGHVQYQDADSVTIEWDQWVMSDVEGYNVYVRHIDSADIPHIGVTPPWIQPTESDLHSQLGHRRRLVLTDLDPWTSYSISVANRTAEAVGEYGEVMIIQPRKKLNRPDVHREYVFARPGERPQILWNEPDSVDIDHYNIYKFDDRIGSAQKFHPFYDTGLRADSLHPVDTIHIDGQTYYYYEMEVYAQLDSGVTYYYDSRAKSGNRYVITAVDKTGLESAFSVEVAVDYVDYQSQDILVLTQSEDPLVGFVTYDSVKTFYDYVLNGYDYDIYMFKESTLSCGFDCFNWQDMVRYRMVIIDDGLEDLILDGDYEQAEQGFTRYVLSGGRLAYFGGFHGFTGSHGVDYFRDPAYFTIDNAFVRRFFGIDSIFSVGLAYYHTNAAPPYEDSLFGFVRAEPVLGLMPQLSFDTSRTAFKELLGQFWPLNTAPIVSAFQPNGFGETTHLFRTIDPSGSMVEGHTVGVRTVSDMGITYLFGFHLWYMDYVGARQLIDYMMLLPTPVEEQQFVNLPENFRLGQNFPNPFNAATRIPFALPRASTVTLEIYDILGRKVRTLLDRRPMTAGSHTVQWDGTSGDDKPVASGIYLLRIRTDEASGTRKMILLK